MNAIIAFAEQHILDRCKYGNNPNNNARKKIKGYLRRLLVIEYLKFFNSKYKQTGKETWKDEDTKTNLTRNLDTPPDQNVHTGTQYVFEKNNTVDSVMKLTMMRYPRYIKEHIEKGGKKHQKTSRRLIDSFS